ncbi:serine O-acetyltransferase [Salegentibacter chungangensis]|uniref:Serine acetyltransferase n=1 Tax=Salegentibacter chungangensis TaxID=1335724 RepID=A0ABW3NWA2_9FLAO
MKFIKSKCKIELHSDFQRYNPGVFNFRNFIKLFLIQPCFRYMVLFRISNNYTKKSLLGLIARIWFNCLKSKFGLQIYLRARIGKGFRLNHYGNILINQGVEIGDNCNVAQGVSIGNVSRGRLKGCPKIGDRVWIGPNAVVVGKIKIGNDVLIAPLSYVNCDIPDKAVVSGNPCKIHNYHGSGVYVKNIYEENLR